MKTAKFILITILGIVAALEVPVAGRAEEAKSAGEKEVVAIVNGEEIFKDELYASLAEKHKNMGEQAAPSEVKFEGILERIINTRLILQEARDVGLDERPEIREKVQIFQEQMLVRMLKNRKLKGLEPDKGIVEKVYKDEVRQWEFKAISFEEREKARAFRDEVSSEDDFISVGERYVDEGSAVWDGSERVAREIEIAPELAGAFVGKKVGSVTPVITAMRRYFVFQLTGVSYPDDDAARKRAKRQALVIQREAVLKEYTDRLIEKYVSIDEKVLETVDQGDSGDIENDKRILAKIKGEDPVIVADLAVHLQGKFYHGDRSSKYSKAIKSDPKITLRELLEERVLKTEARAIGIDRSERFLDLVEEYENSLVFGMYLERFLVPQAHVSEEEVRSEYEAQPDKYLMPLTAKVDAMTFGDRASADRALESLKRGTDMKWLSKNVQGLKEEGISRDELILETLPEEVQDTIGGLDEGDAGIYEADDDVIKVFVVREAPERKVKPLGKVRSDIRNELFGKKLKQVIEDLADELRGLSEIVIFKERLVTGTVRQGRE